MSGPWAITTDFARLTKTDLTVANFKSQPGAEQKADTAINAFEAALKDYGDCEKLRTMSIFVVVWEG